MADEGSCKESGGETVIAISSSDGYVPYLKIPLPVMTSIGS